MPLLRLPLDDDPRPGDRAALDATAGAVAGACGALDSPPAPALLHVDHVIPRAQGGTDELDNLVTACPPCNLAKYDRTPVEWAAAA